MIPEPEKYFRALLPERDELLRELEREAEAEGIPIVGPLAGALLTLLARATNARTVLELGTASGYSAICLARGLADGGRLITLERDPAFARRAAANLARAGLGQVRVDLRQADAREELPRLVERFDLIFLDVEKADYAPLMPACRRLLRRGGLLVADNTAFAQADGFNRAMAADRGFLSVSLLAFLPGHAPEHDGLCLALRL
jgi:predicted O-methyltransferase YrrM